MNETIKASQTTGEQIDHDLKAILDVLDSAPDHNGQVLYIRHGVVDFADGERLFDIISL